MHTQTSHTEPRFELLMQFANQYAEKYGFATSSVSPASADASFRRYFRVKGVTQNYIIMDAPPNFEDCKPFIHISAILSSAGLHVPVVLAHNLEHGFLLLTDLGQTTYLSALQTGSDHRPLYSDAINALITMQTNDTHQTLPIYTSDKLMQEMQLFETWFLNKHHNIYLNDREKQGLNTALNTILSACDRQAKTFVHRDYHCRNLMVCQDNNPGILDFQDAVLGPYTYDLASLLRDAYIDWPEDAQIDLAIQYWKRAQAAGVAVPEDFGEVWRDFEWMGIQRHLKVLGIFARLYHRDGKDGYLADLPVVFEYAKRMVQRYDGLGILVRLFDRVQGLERPAGITF